MNPLNGDANQFVVGSSTQTSFIINNAGRVGVGTTSPSALLSLNAPAGTNSFAIGSSTATYFLVNASANVGIGTAASGGWSGTGKLSVRSTSGEAISAYGAGATDLSARVDSTGNYRATWFYGASLVGSVTTNDGASAAYNTTSDRRVKENIATTTLGLDALMRLPVREFSFIADLSHAKTTGFIAQELYEVFPWAVTKNGENGIDPLGASSSPWGADYGRITPLLARRYKT